MIQETTQDIIVTILDKICDSIQSIQSIEDCENIIITELNENIIFQEQENNQNNFINEDVDLDEHIVDQELSEEVFNSDSIVQNIIDNIIKNSLDKIEDEQTYENLNKYEYTPHSFMKNKLNSIQEEVLSHFGNQNHLELKKTYSKLEKEKIELEKRKNENAEICKENISANLNYINNFKKQSDFMTDAKIHKSVLEREREKVLIRKGNLLGNKRAPEENSETAIGNKRQSTHFDQDWSSLMSTSIKKKSQLQLEKEKFVEESKRKQEEILKKKNNLGKSQVFKFDDMQLNGNQNNKANLIKSENIIVNNNIEVIRIKTCESCQSTVEHNFKKLSQRCDHYMHQKCWIKQKLQDKVSCIACKKQKQN